MKIIFVYSTIYVILDILKSFAEIVIYEKK
jgi:hypothetical protein